jgi:UDP-N-acetylglucosamine 2-epimerase (non-hydrolysing)
MRLALVAGARPNFVKVAPLVRAFDERGWDTRLVHTGQHYDDAMSGSFFADLGMRPPDAELHAGSGRHGAQTARVMTRFESWLVEHPVDTVVVVGDVNSTLACALVAAKADVPVAHVEAGLRSFDRTMPEEVNRILVDALSSWLLTPSADADENLRREGVHPGRVTCVGNVLVDSLHAARARARDSRVRDALGLGGRFGLVTLHRPGLVEDPARLGGLLGALATLSEELPLVFPVHPRTRQMLGATRVVLPSSVVLCPPQRYLDFVALESDATLVLTDSGGVQEETTCLGVPCLTVRPSTERPITVEQGTNRVVGTDPAAVLAAARATLAHPPAARRPPLWDGRAAGRIADAIARPVPAEVWAPAA